MPNDKKKYVVFCILPADINLYVFLLGFTQFLDRLTPAPAKGTVEPEAGLKMYLNIIKILNYTLNKLKYFH